MDGGSSINVTFP
jgi:hypothetical protein